MNPLNRFSWYRRLRGGYWVLLANGKWSKTTIDQPHDEEHRTWQSARGMGWLVTISVLSICTILIAQAAPPPTTAVATFNFLPDTNDMAGLTTNAYITNITVLFYSTKNVNQPTNQWPIVAWTPLVSLLPQGPVGSWWVYSFPIDGKAAFYALTMTNGNGGASPFSNLAPGLTGPNTGTILPLKLQ
jgi:hypothetical protein